jgi:hypothetical protein
VDHLVGNVPDAPDPSLAYSDPAKYWADKAKHDAALTQVQKLIELGQAPKQIKQTLTEADRDKMTSTMERNLVDMFPKVATKDGREKFFADVNTVAAELGIPTDELKQVTDHRLFALAHWAKIGMDSQKARASAKAKAQAAPPATPRKPGTGARKANGNAEAMKRLSRTGSIRDAVNIDWD